MQQTNDYLPKNKRYRRLLEQDPTASRSLYSDAWQRLKKDKAAMTGLILIACFVALALVAPLFPSINPEAIESRRVVDGETVLPPYAPSLKNLMGTDQLGRDIFARVLYGIRVSLLVGVVARGLTMLLGVTLGVVSAYYGGWVDAVIMRHHGYFSGFPGHAAGNGDYPHFEAQFDDRMYRYYAGRLAGCNPADSRPGFEAEKQGLCEGFPSAGRTGQLDYSKAGAAQLPVFDDCFLFHGRSRRHHV